MKVLPFNSTSLLLFMHLILNHRAVSWHCISKWPPATTTLFTKWSSQKGDKQWSGKSSILAWNSNIKRHKPNPRRVIAWKDDLALSFRKKIWCPIAQVRWDFTPWSQMQAIICSNPNVKAWSIKIEIIRTNIYLYALQRKSKTEHQILYKAKYHATVRMHSFYKPRKSLDLLQDYTAVVYILH